MIVGALDFETTGLDAETDEATEVGLILWCTARNAPVQMFNSLIKTKVPITTQITKLTGIDSILLETFGREPQEVWDDVAELLTYCDYLMAHNAPFDRGFLLKNIPEASHFDWIDTAVDIPYTEEISTRKLTHLACEHGFVNPFAHRALTDVLTMCRIFSQYKFEDIINYKNIPSIELVAQVTFSNNQKAKNLSYRWNPERKVWFKPVKENLLNEELNKATEAGFSVKYSEIKGKQ